MNFEIEEVAKYFQIKGTLKCVKKFGSGHINKTYLVETVDSDSDYRYILQRINDSIFTNVEELMNNYLLVINHLKKKIEDKGEDTSRKTITLINTLDNKTYYYNPSFGYYRMLLYNENSICYDQITCTEDFVTVARSFADFLNLLADFPTEKLFEVIKDFHNTKKRFETFMDVLNKDPLKRSESAKKEIDFILEREHDTHHLVDLIESKELPLRVTHNDTKLNNILFDKDTMEALCIIDLDTIMPGLCAYDFGDSIRFGANDCKEDEQDLTKVNFSLPLFEAFTKGYLDIAKKFLTDNEVDSLIWGAKIITLECGIRFLTDYLSGDTYFGITRENQNLDRCRTQLKLVKDMEEHWEEMESIVNRYR